MKLEFIEHVSIVFFALLLIRLKLALHIRSILLVASDSSVSFHFDLNIKSVSEDKSKNYCFHELGDGVFRNVDHLLVGSVVYMPLLKFFPFFIEVLSHKNAKCEQVASVVYLLSCHRPLLEINLFNFLTCFLRLTSSSSRNI